MTDFSSGWSTLISAEKTACYHISRGGTVMQKLWEQDGSYLLGPGVWWSPGAAPPGWRRSAGCGERWTSSVCRNQSGLAWKDRKHWEWRIWRLQSRAFDAGDVELLPVFVDEGVESHSIAPAGGEVVDVDVGIAVKHKPELSDIKDSSTFVSLFWTSTHPAVFIWHHRSSASLAERFSLLSSVSTLMSWICYTHQNTTQWTFYAFLWP